MTSHPVATSSPSAAESSPARRGPLRGGGLISVVAIMALLSGCGGGGSTGSVGGPHLGSVSGAAPADQGGAAPGHCDGTIAGRTVDEVDVPTGATCTLVRSMVN